MFDAGVEADKIADACLVVRYDRFFCATLETGDKMMQELESMSG